VRARVEGSKAPKPRAEQALTLRRTLSLWHVSLTGIGVILGAGVYALIGPAAALAGRGLWLSFVLAGAAAALTAYSYARLGSMRPKASPEFQYTALAFGPGVGFVAGWLMLVGDIAAAASVALGFGGYLGHLLGTPTVVGAGGLVLVAAVAMYAGIGRSVAVAALLTVVEAAGLLVVIAVGLPSWSQIDFRVSAEASTGVFGAAALIFFAYLGFDELGNLAEEMHAPERDLPRALFISLVVTTVIYVAVALSATAVVSPDALGASSAPLALVVGSVLGGRGDVLLTLMALAATANTVLLLLVSAARSVYGMAEAGVLPGRLSRLTATRVPREAMIAVLLVALGMIALGDLSRAAHLTDAMVLISFMCVNLGLTWLGLRHRVGTVATTRRLDIVVSAMGALMCGWLLWHGGWVWIVAAGGVGLLGAGGVMLGRAAAGRATTHAGRQRQGG
jgi:basic amino acid/polyamine antiporter, APA family